MRLGSLSKLTDKIIDGVLDSILDDGSEIIDKIIEQIKKSDLLDEIIEEVTETVIEQIIKALTGEDVDIELGEEYALIQVTAKTTGRTGVEMEALTAASVAALTFYDMCKSVTKCMVIESVYLLEKTGGKSGDYRKKD